ncbi:hypothetical protein ACH5AI_31255 [Streptomyces collinus]|uniref:hypothetical protein n=1 Tax=Streptomyces collinus TaxID=42684 RepID=UPI003792ABC1
MRLEEQGRSSSVPEILERLPDREWSWALEEFEFWNEPPTVRLHPSGCSTREPVETGDGPFFVVVDGDLTTSGPCELWTQEYTPGVVVVTGDLNASVLSFGNNTRAFVKGDVRVTGACVGQYGDHNAMLDIDGELSARALLMDPYTSARAGAGVRALIYGGDWDHLRPDIVNDGVGDDSRFFRPELLRHTETGPRLSLSTALRVAYEGEDLFLPGVEERFPARLLPRRDAG